MYKNNKKGFTLVELLGILVVLAVIALVTIPIVINIIDSVKINALRSSAQGLLETTNLFYAKNMDDIESYLSFTIKDGVQTDSNGKLTYKGSVKNGFVRLTSDGKVALCIDNGEHYATKTLLSTDINTAEGKCTEDFDESFNGYITTGAANYIGLRLNVQAYTTVDELPATSNEGYVGVINTTKINNYYVSNEGITSPDEGDIWIVQNSTSDKYIKNDKSKIGVSCVMQYVDGTWQPKESYVYNTDTWVQLSEFSNSSLVWEYDYTGSYQTFTAPYSGMYKVELWGAQGGSVNTTYTGGLGAYTKGEVYLDQGEKLYVYVGQQPTTVTGGWNGGGTGFGNARGGGGATDVRTVNNATATVWNDANSLRSRIMVAAGGSGASVYETTSWYSYGAAGGGLQGLYGIAGANAIAYKATAATQSGGGKANDIQTFGTNGSFGMGGTGYQSTWSAGGGGSGWYGGAGMSYAGSSITGGSSYISGHLGCSSINSAGINTGSAYSWTGYYFTNTKMVDGEGYEWTTFRGTNILMPAKNASGYVSGNSANGYAKISLSTPSYKSEAMQTEEINNNNKTWAYDFSGNYQIFTAPKNGTYKFELWGAQGGSNGQYLGGLGGYTTGEIYLTANTTLYVYVGGTTYSPVAGWNGGGAGYATGRGGGGATDIRTVSTSSSSVWNETNSLRSRIMVAGGGSGSSIYDTATWAATGGAGGGLLGKYGTGGSSALAYISLREAGIASGGVSNTTSPGVAGTFGIGGAGFVNAGWSSGGGGAGWYGGAGAAHAGGVTTGGSSYISGHLGVDSIDSSGNHTGSAYSWTGYIFTNTKMIDGDGYNWTTTKENQINQPNKLTSGSSAGNGNSGYARITLVKEETITNYTNTRYANENTWAYGYNGNYQVFTAPHSGNYKIELWGAQGTTKNTTFTGGLGAYTKGEIYLTANTTLYVYVGGKAMLITGGYNGGGAGNGAAGGAGGGATDVRTVSGAWNNVASLRSRIIVAAGGAGASIYDTATWATSGGSGGGLLGKYGTGGSNTLTYKSQTPAGQIAGGISGTANPGGAGIFGTGGAGFVNANWASNGGGAGWYGGAGGAYAGGVTTGGSSYISGHFGCIGVNADGTIKNTTASTISDSYSWTNYKFTNTVMIDGDGYQWTTSIASSPSYMTSSDGTKNATGNSGDGYAKITYLGT
ncbi:MAG: glycine-rich protein [Bacilli bacterium]|nr:glycine-rich protein [Bacilli bacterium]